MIPFLRKYFGAIYFPVLWTLIVGFLLCLPGSMLPNESGFSIPQFDKFVHASMFGGFVFLWNLYLSRRAMKGISLPTTGGLTAGVTQPADLSVRTMRLLRAFFLVFILANLYGAGMEFVQKYWIPNRDFDEADIIFDMTGAGLAYGLSHLWLIPAGL